jgi:soluble lytic murein transglycosylase-like protein
LRTTAEPTGSRSLGALLTALALTAWAPEGVTQTADTAAAQRERAAHRPSAPRADGAGRDFWQRLRAEAHQLRTVRSGPAAYALRYRISPQLSHSIYAAAEAQGLDPDLGYRLVRAESSFNPRARSRAGALGLTQLMPGTARWLEPRMTTPERIMEPEANLAVGFRYLRRLIDKYDDLDLALLAYNRGEGAVDRDLRRGRNPENGYTRMVRGSGPARYHGDGRRRGD